MYLISGPLPYMMIGEKYFQGAMTLNWLVNFAVLSSFPFMQVNISLLESNISCLTLLKGHGMIS